MKTFAVVAVRLIGLWIISSASGGFFLLAAQLLQPGTIWRDGDALGFVQATVILTPLFLGILLMVFARPIASLVVRGVASDAPPPEPIAVRGFAQIGVFLLGLSMLTRSIPILVGVTFGGLKPELEHWLSFGLGVLLILATAPIGKLVQQLRS